MAMVIFSRKYLINFSVNRPKSSDDVQFIYPKRAELWRPVHGRKAFSLQTLPPVVFERLDFMARLAALVSRPLCSTH